MTLLALRNSIAILMASLGVAILGLVALDRLPVDLFPNINLPIINVGTIYTGAGVLDIEKTVTYPMSRTRSEEHTSELQSRSDLVCRLLLEKKKHASETHRTSSYFH